LDSKGRLLKGPLNWGSGSHGQTQRAAPASGLDGRAFDIAFALPRRPVRGLWRALTEDQRRSIAKAILEHLKLCGWEFRLPQLAIGHGTGRGRQPA
jgi:hypothetical protein